MNIEFGTMASPADPRENTRGPALTHRRWGGNSADQRFGQSRRRWPRGHWTDSPVRGPLPRHFSMLAFFGELPCQRGAAAVAALSSKPTTTVGAAIDKAGNLLTAQGHANPVIDENSQVKAKNRHQGVPGYMRGSSHAPRMKSSNAK